MTRETREDGTIGRGEAGDNEMSQRRSGPSGKEIRLTEREVSPLMYFSISAGEATWAAASSEDVTETWPREETVGATGVGDTDVGTTGVAEESGRDGGRLSVSATTLDSPATC